MHIFGPGSLRSESRYLLFRYKFFTRVFGCMGLLLLFTALISPYWIVFQDGNTKFNEGLWNICKKRQCRRRKRVAPIIHITRTLMMCTTIMALVAISCALLKTGTLRHSRWPLFTNLLTGILSLITMMVYGMTIKPQGLIGMSDVNPKEEVVFASWSFYMGCLACFLFLFNANVEGARTLLVLALFSSILGASFMTFTYRYSPDAMINRYLVAAMGSLIAGLFALMAHQRLLMQGPTLPDGESTMSSSSSDWLTSSSSFLDTESESAMSQRQDKQSVGTKRTVRSSLTSAGYYNYYA